MEKKQAKFRKPEIIEMPGQKMAVVYTKGNPNEIGEKALSALYGAVYKLKFTLKKEGTEFTVGKLRARWPDAHLKPKNEWKGIWAIPVPQNITELFQKDPEVEVKLEKWDYGTVAQIMHIGPYSEEGPSVQALHHFIDEQGYKIGGVHEEEYLTTPKAKVQKTIIRYGITKK